MELPSFVALHWRLWRWWGFPNFSSPQCPRALLHMAQGYFRGTASLGSAIYYALQTRQLWDFRLLDISAERAKSTIRDLQKKDCAVEGQPKCTSTDSAVNIQNPYAVVEVSKTLFQCR